MFSTCEPPGTTSVLENHESIFNHSSLSWTHVSLSFPLRSFSIPKKLSYRKSHFRIVKNCNTSRPSEILVWMRIMLRIITNINKISLRSILCLTISFVPWRTWGSQSNKRAASGRTGQRRIAPLYSLLSCHSDTRLLPRKDTRRRAFSPPRSLRPTSFSSCPNRSSCKQAHPCASPSAETPHTE